MDLQRKIDELEKLREPAQRKPGRDLGDCSRRELLELYFGVPLLPWQADALRDHPELLDRAGRMADLLHSAVEALRAGDRQRSDALMQERERQRIEALRWMAGVFREARQAKLRELAGDRPSARQREESDE